MSKYTKLSDFEINKAVFIKLYGEESLKDKDMFNSFYRTDYCHNPEDAMPIIIENEISMIKSSGGWMCCHGSVGQVERESLYRGAMELFLMMKGFTENEND